MKNIKYALGPRQKASSRMVIVAINKFRKFQWHSEMPASHRCNCPTTAIGINHSEILPCIISEWQQATLNWLIGNIRIKEASLKRLRQHQDNIILFIKGYVFCLRYFVGNTYEIISRYRDHMTNEIRNFQGSSCSCCNNSKNNKRNYETRHGINRRFIFFPPRQQQLAHEEYQLTGM